MANPDASINPREANQIIDTNSLQGPKVALTWLQCTANQYARNDTMVVFQPNLGVDFTARPVQHNFFLEYLFNVP